MYTRLFTMTLFCASVMLFTACSNSNPKPESETEVQVEIKEQTPEVVLFGSESENWFQKDEGDWSFQGEELVAKVNDQEGFVMTKERFKDFILEMDFHPDSSINSGVFVRCGEHLLNGDVCYEINIWDNRPEQDYRTASIVGLAEPLATINTIDRWNSYKIHCEGDHIRVWLNDTLTADHHDKSFAEGHIGLQAHGTGEIRFKNVKITSLN